jgi:hypothetical protein
LQSITYTKIDTTVYKYAFSSEILPSTTLVVDIDCTSKEDVTCTVGLPDGGSQLSVPGVDLESMLASFMGTTTFSGDSIAYATASVTAGGEKLAAATGGSGASGSAVPMPTGGNATVSGGASPSASKPAEQTGKASALGVEVAALFGVVGIAAAGLL